MKILIATKNPGKAKEVRNFLGDKFELVSLTDLADAPDVEETGQTFEENAIIKAKAYFKWSGIATVTDDGGLKIDCLNGEPGVKSRRWPGYEATDQELIDIALGKLRGVPLGRRTAHLVTVGVFYDGRTVLSETAGIDGSIVESQTEPCQPGYPFRAIFWVPRFGKLFQNLTAGEHDQVNHRKVVYTKLGDKILAL